MSKRIALCSPILAAEFASQLSVIEGVEVTPTAPADLPAAAATADGMVLLGQHYTPKLAEALARPDSRCRWLQVLTAGYEPLVAHGVPARVTVTNAGDTWSPIVAEHTLALLLALVRRLREVEAAQQRAEWDNGIRGRADMLYGANLLILGMGSIGREVALRARPFGMNITGVTRGGASHPSADAMLPLARLHEGLATADAIVVAVPYSDATRHIMGAREFAACKPGAIVVNVARGGVLDATALLAAIEAGTMGGAGLDVTEPEPLPSDSPLWRHPKIIVSPHLGGAAPQRYLQRLVEHVAANVAAFAAGAELNARVTL